MLAENPVVNPSCDRRFNSRDLWHWSRDFWHFGGRYGGFYRWHVSKFNGPRRKELSC